MWHIFIAVVIIFIAGLIGVLIHVFDEGMSWSQAIINTAYIISGIGAPYTPSTIHGHILLAIYGLIVNIMVIALLATIAAPVVHRVLHKFHLDDDGEDEDDDHNDDTNATKH